MPDERLPNLHQLLASTRRRWTILQMLESAGVGLLTASLVLVPILAWQAWSSRSAINVASIILICSCALGLLWGLVKRPSNLQTALLIDRQRNLAELFSSAWLLVLIPSPGTPGKGQGGGLNKSLLSLADTQAQAIQRSSIHLHRLSARTWLLITLMIALNLALIAMASNRGLTKNRLLTEASNNSRQSSQSMDEPLVDLALSSPARPVVPKDPDDPNASHIGGSNSQKPSKEDNHQTREGTDNKTDHTRSDGGGTGIATTHEPNSSHPGRNEQPEQSNHAPSVDAKTAAGSGVADTSASPQHQSNHADAHARVASPPAPRPPWQSRSWQTDVSEAQLAVSRGEVPAAYRDLLSAYFR